MSFRRNDSSTAFLAHWFTVQSPRAFFSATLSAPLSIRSSVVSTASRTAPVVAKFTWSRSSQALSMAAARSAWLMGRSSG